MKSGKMKQAKMHYDQLMSVLADLGLSLEEFEDQMEGESSEEGEEYEEPMEEEEEEQSSPMGKKGKLAIIVAKMKNNKQEMEE
jgi:hypothetical protein